MGMPQARRADAASGRSAGTTGLRHRTMLLAGVLLILLAFVQMAHGFLLLPAAAPVRLAAGARGKGWALSATPRGGPDHSDEPVIKHQPSSQSAHGSRRMPGAPKPGAEEAAGAKAQSEQDLLQQLIESMERDALSETTLDSVLRVYCTHVQPSFAAPWQRLQQMSSTSSGFVIEGRRVITNAHSVEYGSIIQLRKRGDNTKWVAELLAYGPECDLAVLTVKDDRFWEGLEPIEFGELPALLDDVSVVGYPIGGESLSVTAGVVSRIELQEYAQGGETLLAIQIDAAINSGNSGGPVINENDQLVGVAFQSLATLDSENIGYVIPVDILRHFLRDIERHGRYTGFCSLGVKFQPMESPALRRFKQLPEGRSGILVTKVDPLAPANEVLARGDVLMAVDGIDLANDGTIPFRKGERVELHYYCSQLFKGDTVDLTILREGKTVSASVPVYIHKLAVAPHLNNGMPSYLMVGGMVFTVLSHPFLMSNLGETYAPETQADVRLLYLIQCHLRNRDQQLVVLSEILEHETNLGYELFHRQHLVKLNGVAVQNLAQLAQLVDGCQTGELIFEFDRDELLVLDAAAAHRATQEVAATHGIPASRSADLMGLPSAASSAAAAAGLGVEASIGAGR